ncbi:hypothetical protein [Sphingobacterium anhuiense]|uniref:hypothetical protein n=1 Tax=Sphingobacterium anhuiense TaxID=493780 RepID=UPI003C2CF9B8
MIRLKSIGTDELDFQLGDKLTHKINLYKQLLEKYALSLKTKPTESIEWKPKEDVYLTFEINFDVKDSRSEVN